MKCPTLFSMVFISNHSVLGAESLLFWACDYAEKANRTQESSDTVACADTIHDVWNAILGICSWKHFLPQNENGPPFAHCGRPHKTTSTQKPVTKKKKKNLDAWASAMTHMTLDSALLSTETDTSTEILAFRLFWSSLKMFMLLQQPGTGKRNCMKTVHYVQMSHLLSCNRKIWRHEGSQNCMW